MRLPLAMAAVFAACVALPRASRCLARIPPPKELLVPAKPALPRVFLWDAQRLAEAKARLAAGDKTLQVALARLRREADAAVKVGPFSVMQKTATPPSGDKHDYMSIGPYWWPNPKTANRLPYVRRDGEVNPERRTYGDATRQGQMRSAVETLALAWWFTGHKPYAAHAAKLLRVWFLDKATRMNPNLEYGQAIPGRCEGRGIGIVDLGAWPALIDSAGMLTGSDAWTDADEKALRAWFAEFLTWLLKSKHGRDEARTRNNHATQYDAQVASYALFTGQTKIARDVLAKVAAARIDTQIQPDGSQPHELRRTKSWSYSIANTRNFINLARLAVHVKVDLWGYESKDGRSIPKALSFLVPYASGTKRWPHKQISRFHGSSLASLLRRAYLQTGKDEHLRALRGIKGVSASSRDHLLYPLGRP